MTDNNQASELYELCKKVYELTGWDRYLLEDGKERYIDKCYWSYDGKLMSSAVERYKLLFEQFECPLYTSDYLLEKLPQPLTLRKKSYSFEASIRKGNRVYPYANADTPSKPY